MKPQLNVRIAPEIRDTITRYQIAEGIAPGWLVETALREYFKRHKIPVVSAATARTDGRDGRP